MAIVAVIYRQPGLTVYCKLSAVFAVGTDGWWVELVIFWRVFEAARGWRKLTRYETPANMSIKSGGDTGKDIVRPCPVGEAQS